MRSTDASNPHARPCAPCAALALALALSYIRLVWLPTRIDARFALLFLLVRVRHVWRDARDRRSIVDVGRRSRRWRGVGNRLVHRVLDEPGGLDRNPGRWRRGRALALAEA